MVRPRSIEIVIVVVVNAINRIIRTGRIAGVNIGSRGGVVSPRNGAARTVVVSSKRGQHIEAALLVRQKKLALPFLQFWFAAAIIQLLKKAGGPLGDVYFWF